MITGYTWLAVLIVLWELAWKIPALWKSARRSQKTWFIVILVVNLFGLVPILYLLMNDWMKKQAVRTFKAVKRTVKPKAKPKKAKKKR